MQPQRFWMCVPLVLWSCAGHALDWSDTALAWRGGTRFAEPFNPKPIRKNIVSLSHADGYSLGSQFLNVDVLWSDSTDPAQPGSSEGASEVYLVYRHTLDLEKTTGVALQVPGLRGWGATLGFDLNRKSDAGYNSRKRMLVVGPTLMLDVPGFFNVGVHALLRESNAPVNRYTGVATPRYTYKNHVMLTANWGVPITWLGTPWSINGYVNWIAPKGRDEFGAETATETNLDVQLMWHAGGTLGVPPGAVRLGLAYQYWRNKFGNAISGPAGQGARASTPMLRAEWHF